MEKYRKWGLWLRIALPFLLFVVAGSIILCAWLYGSANKASRKLFATLASTNADFIRTSQLPMTERMAGELSRILDLQVCFREAVGGLVPPLEGSVTRFQEPLTHLAPSEGVVLLGTNFEAIATPIDKSHELILIRLAPDSSVLLRPATFAVLGAFWGLSLVLAWTLSQGVVRPLRILALRLPHIEQDDVLSLPGVERNDEIGLLARTYVHTHGQLVAEREKRAKAERLALLGKMATGLAHEINNPLSSIRMHVQLMESSVPSQLAAAAADTIPIIVSETSKIESLVNQWMFLARPAPPQISPVDLRELVEGVVKSMLPQAAHARVAIDGEVAPGLLVSVDARRIRQAVGNIILNAIQAMPNGGALQINGQNGAQVRLVFQDAGRGFSEKALLHYADLFYSEKEGGMGIGLSVSTEIVKAHGGALEVANLPQGGASVTLAFPAWHELS